MVGKRFGTWVSGMAYHVCPCLIPDAQAELYDETEPEEASEEAVGTDARIVAIETAFDGTFGTDCHAIVGGGRRDGHSEERGRDVEDGLEQSRCTGRCSD